MSCAQYLSLEKIYLILGKKCSSTIDHRDVFKRINEEEERDKLNEIKRQYKRARNRHQYMKREVKKTEIQLRITETSKGAVHFRRSVIRNTTRVKKSLRSSIRRTINYRSVRKTGRVDFRSKEEAVEMLINKTNSSNSSNSSLL